MSVGHFLSRGFIFMNKEKYIVPKSLFLFSFIMAIVAYAICLILNIISFVVTAKSLYFSSYWYVYVDIVVSIFLSLGIILCSILMMTLTKEKDKGGKAVINFISYYLLVLAVYSFITAVFYSIYDYSVTRIIVVILAILQISIAVTCVILARLSPKVARIILIVECILFSISNFINFINYIIYLSFINMTLYLVLLAFDIVLVVLLFMMKVKKEEDAPIIKKESAPAPIALEEKSEEEKLTILLKYKELLDKGILTKEEFDMKKKELL